MHLKLKNNMNTTAVPNGLIKAAPGAPGGYIDAYLYTLMQAQQNQMCDLGQLCARLDMRENELMDAFEYWQKKGYVRIHNKQDFSIEFGEFTTHTAEDDVYTERDFNQKLQTIFGSRILSPHDLIKIYDYTDVYRLPKPMVLVLAEYCVLLKGPRVPVSYMDKVADSWAQTGVDTAEKARGEIDAHKAKVSGLLHVLKRLGISRTATRDEAALFEKWTSGWGFTLDAIITACAATTSSREPSMKYLDRILYRLHSEGETTSRRISETAKDKDQENADIGQLLHMLGYTSLKPTFDNISLYQKWTTVYGYDMRIIEAAAKVASRGGKAAFSELDDILTDWYNHQIKSPGQAEEAASAQRSVDSRILAMFKEAGIPRRYVLPAHRKTYQKWREEWGICEDAILLAAEISSTRDNPFAYLSTILTRWHEAGVKTLRDAQSAFQQRFSGAPADAKSEINERTTGNYDHLAVDLFADEGA